MTNQTETLILKTQLSNLFHPHIIDQLFWDAYRKTGNKFSLEFHGSKGYLSHIEISCEGVQKEDNRLFEIFNKDGSIKKKVVNVYHSEKNGIRLSLGNDKARVVSEPIIFREKPTEAIKYEIIGGVDDLPF